MTRTASSNRGVRLVKVTSWRTVSLSRFISTVSVLAFELVTATASRTAAERMDLETAKFAHVAGANNEVGLATLLVLCSYGDVL
jgi:hypothetical protein